MRRSISITSYFVLIVTNLCYGQIELMPLPLNRYFPVENRSSRITEDSTQLSLPFFDDFTQSDYLLDTSLWSESQNVVVMKGRGTGAPSFNSASLDGWNSAGKPYSLNNVSVGFGDSLKSRFIDPLPLSGLGNDVYLNFFYQKEGLGEFPDEDDFLSLWFKDTANQWLEVWNTDSLELETDTFFLETIVLEEQFLHPFFQFQFKYFGNLSGGFDTWQVDYVYVDTISTINITGFNDLSVTDYPTSLFGKYQNVPYKQFKQDPDLYLSNINASFQYMFFTPNNFSIDPFIRNLDTGDTLVNLVAISGVKDTIRSDTLQGGTVQPFEKRIVELRAPDSSDLILDQDSLYMELVFPLVTEDFVGRGISFRQNDSVKVTHILDRELAYDDGSPEFAAGVNVQGGQIAYRFTLNEPEVLTDIKINFQDFDAGVQGKAFILKIYDSLDNAGEGLRFEQSLVVLPQTRIDQFNTYRLASGLNVRDTFYVALEQTIEEFFTVGLDKNTDSSDEIFFNIAGNWEPNQNIKGSLLIRPVFGDPEAIGLKKGIIPDINVYPNPNIGVFTIDGVYDEVILFDLMGNKVALNKNGGNEYTILTPQAAGLYILSIRKGDIQMPVRLMINK